MHKLLKPTVILLTAVLMMTLQACDTSKVTRTLLSAIQAASNVVPLVLDSTELEPVVKSRVLDYTKSVGIAANSAVDILNDPATSQGEKSARIVSAFSKVIAPRLPAGTPARLVQGVDLTAQAVASFLSYIPKHSGNLKASAGASKGTSLKVSKKDLEAVRNESRALLVRVQASK